MENISGAELFYKIGRLLIKKVFGLYLSFNRNADNGSFILNGRIDRIKFRYLFQNQLYLY